MGVPREDPIRPTSRACSLASEDLWITVTHDGLPKILNRRSFTVCLASGDFFIPKTPWWGEEHKEKDDNAHTSASIEFRLAA